MKPEKHQRHIFRYMVFGIVFSFVCSSKHLAIASQIEYPFEKNCTLAALTLVPNQENPLEKVCTATILKNEAVPNSIAKVISNLPLNLGYSDSPIVLLFRVKSENTGEYVLRVGTKHMDIRVFQNVIETSLGKADSLPPIELKSLDENNVFKFESRKGEVTEFKVIAQSESSLFVPVSILSFNIYLEKASRSFFANGMLYGMFLLYLIALIVGFISSGLKLFRIYFCYLISTFIFLSFIDGLLDQMVPFSIGHLETVLILFFYIVGKSEFLLHFTRKQLGFKIRLTLYGLVLSLAVVGFIVNIQYSLIALGLYTLFIHCFGLWHFLFSYPKNNLLYGRFCLVAGLVLFKLSFLLYSIHALGYLNVKELYFYLPKFGIFAEITFVSFFVFQVFLWENRLIRAMKKEKESISESKSRIEKLFTKLQMIAHDIKEPLAIINGCATMLRIKSNSPEVLAIVDDIQDSVKKSSTRVTRALADFSQLSRMKELEKEKTLLADFVNDAVLDWNKKTKLNQHRIILEFRQGFKNRCVSLNREAISVVFYNLFQNAIEQNPDDPGIKVSAASDRDAFKISITNTGSHISKEYLHQIFEPSITMGKKEGSGSGLAIVKEALNLHGWQVSVANICRHDNHEGVQFSIYIPVRNS